MPIIPARSTYLLNIFGTSLKKLDFSTSFLVAPHEMLVESICARIDCERGIDRPPKKKKLSMKTYFQGSISKSYSQGNTHKNGIHKMLVKKARSLRKVLSVRQPLDSDYNESSLSPSRQGGTGVT